MEDKLKRYEKIEFLGEGQVAYLCLILLQHFCYRKVTFHSITTHFRGNVAIVYLSDNRGVAFGSVKITVKLSCYATAVTLKVSELRTIMFDQ